MHNILHKFFYPSSVAVIGVSENPNNLARNIVKNLIDWGYSGEIYLVNPKGGETFDRKIYKSVLDIPGNVDLAAILTPAITVPNIIDECGAKGIKNVTISTGGFGEFSEEGRSIIEKIKENAKRHNIRFVGPNGIATCNTEIGLCLPFARLRKKPQIGNVSILAQSGGVGLSIMLLLSNENIHFNKFVSLGNKDDLDEVDFLWYLKDDPNTKIIILYLESIERGKELIEVAKQINKPIILYKANRGGKFAQQAALSHTAAIASDDKIVDAGAKQAGIMRLDRLHKIAKLAKMFLYYPRLKGNRIIPISLAGGWSVISGDYSDEYKFDLPPLKEETAETLSKMSRAGVIRVKNPMDLGDNFMPDAVLKAIEMAMGQDNIDAVLFAFFMDEDSRQAELLLGFIKQFSELLKGLIEKYQKPFIFCLLSTHKIYELVRPSIPLPIFQTFDDAFEILSIYRDFCLRKERKLEIPQLKVNKTKVEKLLKKEYLSEVDRFEILKCYGINTPKAYLARSQKEIDDLCDKIGYPLVMKISSPDILHKTDVDGVKVGISSKKEARNVFKEILQNAEKKLPFAKIEGVILYKMAPQGQEIIIGMKKDKSFGNVIMFGLGGIFVEVLKDVSFRVLPLSKEDVEDMLSEIKGFPLLTGTRGKKPKDIKSLIDAIFKLSQLSLDFPEISEIDINPLFLYEKGCCAVDIRIIR